MNRIPPELTVEIPPERIAQYPADKRDSSRLLVYDRAACDIAHIGTFRDIIDFISGDLFVINDTRVLPVRVEGHKLGGGKVELLFIIQPPFDKTDDTVIEIDSLIYPSRRLRTGLEITLPDGATYELISKSRGGRWRGRWKTDNAGDTLFDWLDRAGTAPLPPYIRRPPEVIDRKRYQTTYARTPGSLAAPTAGLHFTPDLMSELEQQGCKFVQITLDVGIGTFQPIRENELSHHKMHRERYSIDPGSADAIESAVSKGRRITAVGTTVVRSLESAAIKGVPLQSGEGFADLFIYPPYEFKVVDRLLTNFHRPDSTLIQLLAATIGWRGVNLAYQAAMDQGFRFYSYGDAMLVL